MKNKALNWLFAAAEPGVLGLLRGLEPEVAHNVSVWALRHGLAPLRDLPPRPALTQRLWGVEFENPLGIAAGYDKNAEVIGGLADLGFGFVEVGSVTPRPQKGNPRPRLFRLRRSRAVINRMGFNNDGLDRVEANIKAWKRRGGGRQPPLGINLGKNKDSKDALADYAEGLSRLGRYADYVAVNVSSPNTPGLRDLQAAESLDALIAGLQEARGALPEGFRPPLLLKIAPDLEPSALADIAAIALARDLDGLIVSNTTLARPDGIDPKWRQEAGGLSGAPLFTLSTQVLAEAYRLTEGRLPLIGVGGIGSGRDAYAKVRAGASLLQIYTALVYEGSGLIPRILEDLAACLEKDGFETLSQAVGADHR